METQDRQRLEEIKASFSVLEDMACAVAKGNVKGLVVYGPSGVGKSYNVKSVFEGEAVVRQLFDEEFDWEYVSGYMRPIHLYKKLYEHRNSNTVLILDDCDSVFGELDSLNLLKAALDTLGERWISWNSEAKFLKAEDLPNKFEFKGGIIFITNTDFEHCRSAKIKEHLNAIMSRCHYLDLSIETDYDKFLWLEEVARNSDMLKERGLDKRTVDAILLFVKENLERVKHLDLRLLGKIADHYLINQEDWRQKAIATCLKREIVNG